MCSSVGSSRRTASQKYGSPGASTTPPHTVMASWPPVASHDHARRSVPAMSSRKKSPNTDTTASSDPAAISSVATSATWNSAWVSPRAAAAARACATSAGVRSTPTTRPAGSHAFGGRQGRRAGAAAQVEHPRARRQVQPVDRAASEVMPEGQAVEMVGGGGVGVDDAGGVGHRTRGDHSGRPASRGRHRPLYAKLPPRSSAAGRPCKSTTGLSHVSRTVAS